MKNEGLIFLSGAGNSHEIAERVNELRLELEKFSGYINMINNDILIS